MVEWENGRFLGQQDSPCLRDAAAQGFTLVTYDRRTIPPVLKTWAEEERTHGGVIFVDEKTISPADIGGLVWALTRLARETGNWDWTNRIISCGADANRVDVIVKTNFFRSSALRRDVWRIDEEQRTITQVCEMLLHEGVEAYKKEGPKFMHRLVAEWRTRGAVAKEDRPLPGISRQSSKYAKRCATIILILCYTEMAMQLFPGDKS
jgi:hypothetical protein